jgi:hypothetical protein
MKAVDLARAIGITTQHSVQMQRYEKGERGMSNELLAEAARVLEAPFEWLAFGTGPDPTAPGARILLRAIEDERVAEQQLRYEPAPERIPTVWIEALESGALGRVTPEEKIAGIAFCTGLRGAANEGGLRVADVVRFIEAFRKGAPPPAPKQTEAGAAITEAARASGAAKGHMPLGKSPRVGRR